MNKYSLCLALLACAFVSCSDDDNSDNNQIICPGVDVSLEAFPRIDCSTSTQPLSVILTSKVLNVPYKWWNQGYWDGIWYVSIDYDEAELSAEKKEAIEGKLNCSTTHGSYTNLIDGNVDLIIASRNISRDEQSYADEKGVSLLTKPIGKDAFTFIVNENNPVENLTISQVQDIYTGDITNWKTVGGNDATIDPYVRNANSGSQEKMETLVMAGKTMIKLPEMEVGGMAGPFYAIYADVNGIAYSPNYYVSVMARMWTYAKSLSINGVKPSNSTIRDNTYPYVSEIYAAVRSDLGKLSFTYQLYEALTTAWGQSIVDESGYVPLTE